MKRIVIVGSGNVAQAFALALTEAGMPPVQIYARNGAAGRELAAQCGAAYTDDGAQVMQADLYLIAVTDRAIASVAASFEAGNAVVAHTSGTTELEALAPKVHHRAVLYPLQTFTKGRRIDFRTVPLLVEGATAQALACVTEVAEALSERVVRMDSAQLAMLHLAAVFACNFTNYMYTVGEELLAEAGLDFSLLRPLILETAHKAADASSPRLTQTGPAVRNDFQTKSRHCEMLREKPDLKSIYIMLSKNIWETSKKTLPK